VNSGSTNLGIAFNGWTDPAQAISASNNVINQLQGQKFISLGGGNENGRWTGAFIQKISSYCTQGLFNGYTGIAFDIEEGDGGLTDLFISCFRECKSRGYKVLVTISHSTPYGIPDGNTLMGAFFREASTIDYMSPQLYTSGYETVNDFAANGVGWADYKPFSGKLIPSIVSANLYSSAQNYFAGLGITTVGYVQWSQTASTGPAPSTGAPTSSGSTGGTVRCGANWAAASSGCGTTCSLDSDCPSGQFCFKDLTPCTASSTRCGPGWDTANNMCGVRCTNDSQCSNGQKCWAALSLVPCRARAVAENSNVFSETTPVTGKELSPLTVGLIVGGCVVFVVVVAVIVVVVVTSKKVEEQV